jgi:hypothetical protein
VVEVVGVEVGVVGVEVGVVGVVISTTRRCKIKGDTIVDLG